jgi:branched-chain amino acid transport system substrate-binding protein
MKKEEGMMKKRFIVAFAIGVLLAGFTTVGYAAETINIAFSGALSGGAAKFVGNCLNGAELAIAEINAAGGITVNNKNYVFKLTTRDDAYKPANTVSNIRRMLTTLDPKPVFGFCPSSGAILALETFNEKEGFLIYGYTDNVELFKNGNKLVLTGFAAAFNNSGPVEAGFARGYRTIGLLSDIGETGRQTEKVTRRQWEELGGEVVSADAIPYMKVTDFYPYLTKAIAKNPDCLFLYGPAEPAAMLAKQARELGFKGGFILGAWCKLDEMLKVISLESLNNSVGPCPVEMTPVPNMEGYAKRHRAHFGGNPPSSEGSSHYEVMYIIAEAMKKAGSVTDAYKIRAAIPQVLPVGDHSVTGIFDITSPGQFLRPWYSMEIRDNKLGRIITADPLPWCKKYGPLWPAIWSTAKCK